MNSVIISNCIVSKNCGNGICIRSIKLEKKMNPNLNIDLLQKFSYGNKKDDHFIIQQLSNGLLKFEDLQYFDNLIML